MYQQQKEYTGENVGPPLNGTNTLATEVAGKTNTLNVFLGAILTTKAGLRNA